MNTDKKQPAAHLRYNKAYWKLIRNPLIPDLS